MTVNPTVSETYQLTFQGLQVYSANVTVKPSAESYLVVGSITTDNVSIVVPALQALSTKPVTLQPTLPATVSSDALIIDESATISPSDLPKVMAYLQQGKGVVFLNRAPNKLATGDVNNTDVSSIQPWFGGGPTLQGSGGSMGALPGTLVPRPLTLLYSTDTWPLGAGLMVPLVNPGADQVAGYGAPFMGDPSNYFIVAFGYAPSVGGRVFWEGSATFHEGPLLLAAAARWAATGVNPSVRPKKAVKGVR